MPHLDWAKFVAAHFFHIWLLSLGWVIVVFALRYFWHRSKGRYFEDPRTSAVIYTEQFASGRSLKSWRTRLGSASNCLRVFLTEDRLFVRPIFPFLILGPDFDLVHSVPLKNIDSVTRRDRAFLKGLRIRFLMADGTAREIEILSRKAEQFERTLAALIGQTK